MKGIPLFGDFGLYTPPSFTAVNSVTISISLFLHGLLILVAMMTNLGHLTIHWKMIKTTALPYLSNHYS